jgi:hypothetical protein
MATTTNSKWKPDAELVRMLENPPKPVCNLGKVIAEHPDGKKIEKALANPKWTNPQLASVLSKRTVPMSAGTIGKHRNGECICYSK